MFQSFRVFTIRTDPGNWTVHRSRDDLKWLVQKLKLEFPQVNIPEVDKGQLSKKIIEDFFDLLLKQNSVYASRFLRFFLSSDDKKFKARRERDSNWFSNFVDKIMPAGNNINLEDLQLGKEDTNELEGYDEVNLQIFLDELHETLKMNDTHYQNVAQNCSDLTYLFQQISQKVFQLADSFSKLS